MRRYFIEVKPFDSLEIGCQVSGVSKPQILKPET